MYCVIRKKTSVKYPIASRFQMKKTNIHAGVPQPIKNSCRGSPAHQEIKIDRSNMHWMLLALEARHNPVRVQKPLLASRDDEQMSRQISCKSATVYMHSYTTVSCMAMDETHPKLTLPHSSERRGQLRAGGEEQRRSTL
jgi:hypothetical protein